MKVFKQVLTETPIEVTLDQAVAAVREFNREFCHDKSDSQIFRQLATSPIHTNLSKYWIEL